MNKTPMILAGAIALLSLSDPWASAAPLRTAQPLTTIAQNKPKFGRPQVRSKGGRKGLCDRTSTGKLAAAVETSAISASRTPMFAIWVPKSSAVNLTAKVRIQKAGENVIEPMVIPLGTTPGIVTFRVPESANLQLNQGYRWSFEVTCGNGEKESIRGDFTVKEMPPELVKQLATAQTPVAQAKLYDTFNFSLDAVAVLVTAKASNPDAQRAWEELIQKWEWTDVP